APARRTQAASQGRRGGGRIRGGRPGRDRGRGDRGAGCRWAGVAAARERARTGAGSRELAAFLGSRCGNLPARSPRAFRKSSLGASADLRRVRRPSPPRPPVAHFLILGFAPSCTPADFRTERGNRGGALSSDPGGPRTPVVLGYRHATRRTP